METKPQHQTQPGRQPRQPEWWSNLHSEAWERTRDAFRRDWEQTKADLHAHGRDLNQNAVDTIKQLVGADVVPPLTVKTHVDPPAHAARLQDRASEEQKEGAKEKAVKANTGRDRDSARWVEVEPAVRYGYGLRARYSAADHWTDRVEDRARAEWRSLYGGASWDEGAAWDEVKDDVRRGWDHATREIKKAGVHPDMDHGRQ